MKNFVLLLIIFFIVFALIYFFKKYIVMSLSEILYGKKDINLFFRKINSASVKLLLGKKFVLMSQIDAYKMMKDYTQLESLFSEIRGIKLNAIELFIVIQKEIQVCCDCGNINKANSLLNEMKDIVIGEKVEKGSKLYQTYCDCKYDISLRLEKNGVYAEEIYQRGQEQQNEAAATIYYIKAAQSYHLKNDRNKKIKCLNEAKKLVKGSQFEKDIEAVINGNEDIMKLFEENKK